MRDCEAYWTCVEPQDTVRHLVKLLHKVVSMSWCLGAGKIVLRSWSDMDNENELKIYSSHIDIVTQVISFDSGVEKSESLSLSLLWIKKKKGKKVVLLCKICILSASKRCIHLLVLPIGHFCFILPVNAVLHELIYELLNTFSHR